MNSSSTFRLYIAFGVVQFGTLGETLQFLCGKQVIETLFQAKFFSLISEFQSFFFQKTSTSVATNAFGVLFLALFA